MVWVLFEMLVFNLWPTLPVFYFFSTSSRNFSCNCYKIFCIKPIWCGTKRIFLPLWSLTSGQRLLTTFERCSWYITSSGKKKKKKMLRIFFQILQVADEAYFNKIRCRCVFVLSSLVRTCKSHVKKDAGWYWSLGDLKQRKIDPVPGSLCSDSQTFVCRLSADYSSHTV